MTRSNIFLKTLLLLSVFGLLFAANKVTAETTVIINNINSTTHEVELRNTTATNIDLASWRLVQQNLPANDQNLPITTDLSGIISASGDKVISVANFGATGAVFYLYDQLNNLVMSATIAIDDTAPVISGVSPLAGSRVGSLTTLTFSSSKFTDPGCQVDGLNWGNPCDGSTFAAIPGWGNVPEGPFTLTIKDTDTAGHVGRLAVEYIKDITTPILVSATAVTATTISLEFNENLQTNLVTSDFMVSSGGGENSVVSATVENKIVTLTLQNSFLNTDIITLDINPFKPISIKDSVGNEFVPLETIAVINSIPEVVVEVVVIVPEIPSTPPTSSSGGGGGSSGSRTTGYAPAIQTPTPPGQVLGFTIFKFNRNLAYGQKHPDVIELQKRLMKEGFLASSTPTDYFGSKTLAAVKLYQKQNKLPIIGYVGAMTRSALNGWFVKNRPENQLASILEQIQNLQNLINAMLGKTSQ